MAKNFGLSDFLMCRVFTQLLDLTTDMAWPHIKHRVTRHFKLNVVNE